MHSRNSENPRDFVGYVVQDARGGRTSCTPSPCFGSRRSPVRIRAPRSALRANPAFGCWISLKGPFNPRLAGAGFAKRAGNGSRGQSHKCANFCANFDAHPAYLDVLERARCAFQPDVSRILSTGSRKNVGCVRSVSIRHRQERRSLDSPPRHSHATGSVLSGSGEGRAGRQRSLVPATMSGTPRRGLGWGVG